MNRDDYNLIVDGKLIPVKRFRNLRSFTLSDELDTASLTIFADKQKISLDFVTPRLFTAWGTDESFQLVEQLEEIQNSRASFQDPSGKIFSLTNEILVSFVIGANEAERENLVKNYGGEVVETTQDFWRVRIADKAVDAPLVVAAKMSYEAIVIYAEPDAIQANVLQQLNPTLEPNFGDQWHLQNLGQNNGVIGADVKAVDAWKISTGSRNVRIVVHDSGVDTQHPDLAQNILPGWNFDNNNNNPRNPNSPHGTACAGVIAAAVNGAGVTGIAPGCAIVPLRAAGSHSWSEWANTFDWAAQQGQIISCSWTITPNNTLSQAIRRAVSRGVTVFCAAGNSGAASIDYPASLPETIAVGASTNQDVRASYSQTGTGLDLVAPSSGGTLRIETTDIAGPGGYNTGDYCRASDRTGFGGTSSATPLVAGVAALMLSVNPNLRPDDLRRILRRTADKIDTANGAYGPDGWSPQYGFGRVNALRALEDARKGFFPVYQQGDPGNGIGGYDLRSPNDRVFPLDYKSSGKLDHLALYRPATGTIWILRKNPDGSFTAVYQQGDPGNGIGGYDLKSAADRAFAFDYDSSGKQDHVVFYRPGTGTIWILKKNPDGSFRAVYQQGDPGHGIGGYDLKSGADRIVPFDYNSSGKLDHLALYRPATGTIWILRKRQDGSFSAVYQQGDPGSGIGGYDLKSPYDRIFSFDYDSSGKQDHLALYRPATGTIWILKKSPNGSFSAVYQQGDPGAGIGGYDLKSPNDRVFPFDYDSSGKLDHLVLYRPATGTVWILKKHPDGSFRAVYQQGDPGSGIGGYDLKSAADRMFAYDYNSSGKLDHLTLFRPGTGTIWILERRF